MSNLSELLPTGGGQNAVDFVASGTLSSGQTVVLNADGTVSAVASGTFNTPNNFVSVQIHTLSTSYDSAQNKIVVAYGNVDNSYYGTAVVGTVSGTSISFGTPVVYRSERVDGVSAVYDVNAAKHVISQKANSEAFSIVGTVSGTSISFGSSVQIGSTNSQVSDSCYDATNQKIVVWYRNAANNYPSVRIGTVSGTSISFGTAVTFTAVAYASTGKLSYDSAAGKVLFVWNDSTNNNYASARVGTVSGTSISFGTASVFYEASPEYLIVTYNTASQNHVIAYRNTSSPYQGDALVATISGTSVSFGAVVSYSGSSRVDVQSITYDSTEEKVIITYADFANSYFPTAVSGTVSGTSISFDSPLPFNTTRAYRISAVYDSTAEKTVSIYATFEDSIDAITASLISIGSTGTGNVADFIGITAEAISDTATGAVNVYGGINEAQTGLTIGADYYVQDDGSLGSPTASTPYVIDGASYDSVSFSVASQEASPIGIAFNTDGTKMFIVGTTGGNANEYTLSIGFDVSTAVYSQNFSLSGQETSPTGIAFNSDGTKMFIVGIAGDDVNEYILGTGFDVSTASFVDSFSVASQDTEPRGIAFNTDGTKMFIVGNIADDINEYTLGTGFDVSTASFVDSFSVSPQESIPTGIAFNNDGTKMFITGLVGDDVNEYILGTGFDVSTATYSQNFSVSAQETSPTGIAFNNEGTKMFVLGDTGNSVYQYSTGVGSLTSVKVGQAISATTINMMDLT